MKLPSLSIFFEPVTLKLIDKIWNMINTLREPPGPYKVLDSTTSLEICDPNGQICIHRKYKKVRFLQNHVFAYLDQTYGEGELFADFQCSPGVVADRWRDGNRWWTLISLREIKNRDQTEEFQINRVIQDGFSEDDVHFHTNIEQVTQHLTIEVLFPKERLPRRILLIQQNKKHSTEAKSQLQDLPDKRQKLVWEIAKPQRFETYSIQWAW